MVWHMAERRMQETLDAVGPLIAAHDRDVVAQLWNQLEEGSLPRVEYAALLGELIAASLDLY